MNENIDILVKLFETLKTSTDKNEEAVKQLIVQQLELVNQIKHLPIEDLRLALKEHARESAKDIDTCSETVTTTTSDLMLEVKKLNAKVVKMLIAISLTIAIATGGYFIIRSTADNETVIEKHLDKKFNELSKQFLHERNEEIEKIREEMRNLHSGGVAP